VCVDVWLTQSSQTPLPADFNPTVLATHGTQYFYEEKTKSTSWIYPVLSVDPSKEVGNLRKLYDTKYKKNNNVVLLMYYGLSVMQKKNGYRIEALDDSKLMSYDAGMELGMLTKYDGKKGRKAEEIVRGLKQMEEDKGKAPTDRGAHMDTPDVDPDAKVHVDKFYKHKPSGIICRSVVEVRGVIRYIAEEGLDGKEAYRRFLVAKKDAKKPQAAAADGEGQKPLVVKPMPQIGAVLSVVWEDSTPYVGTVVKIDVAEGGKRGFFLEWDAENTESFVPLTGDWKMKQAVEDEEMDDFGEDSDEEEGGEDKENEEVKVEAEKKIVEVQQEQPEVVAMETQ